MKYANLKHSFRQAWLVAILGVLLLVMQSGRLLAWWDAALLIVIFGLAELYIRSSGARDYELR